VKTTAYFMALPWC